MASLYYTSPEKRRAGHNLRRLPEQDGDGAEVEVDKVLGFCCQLRSHFRQLDAPWVTKLPKLASAGSKPREWGTPRGRSRPSLGAAKSAMRHSSPGGERSQTRRRACCAGSGTPTGVARLGQRRVQRLGLRCRRRQATAIPSTGLARSTRPHDKLDRRAQRRQQTGADRCALRCVLTACPRHSAKSCCTAGQTPS